MNKQKINYLAASGPREIVPTIVAMDINGVLLKDAKFFLISAAFLENPFAAIKNLLSYKINGFTPKNRKYIDPILEKVSAQVSFLPNAQDSMQMLGSDSGINVHICSNMGNYDILYKRLRQEMGNIISRKNFHISEPGASKLPLYLKMRTAALPGQELIAADDEPDNILNALYAGFDFACLITTDKNKIANAKKTLSKELGEQVPEYFRVFPSVHEFSKWQCARKR